MYSIITQRIKITTNELKGLPPLIGGFLVLSSFAIDEITQLHKIQVGTLPNRTTEDETAGMMVAIQQNAVLRNLNTKLYEYNEVLKDTQNLSRSEGLTDLSDFFAGFSADLKTIRKGVGFKIAEFIRNKFASHFSISEAKKALMDRNSNDVHVLLPDQTRGNSFHPLGEEILFYSVFNNADLTTDKMTPRASTDAWISWILNSSEKFQNIHGKFLIFVFRKYFPNRSYEKIFVQMDRDRHIGTLRKTSIPIWWEKPNL